MGAYNGVGHGLVCSQIGYLHVRQQSNAVAFYLRLVNRAGMLQHPLLEAYPAQQPRLLALGGMILEVLAEVALVARLGYGFPHLWQFHVFQLM